MFSLFLPVEPERKLVDAAVCFVVSSPSNMDFKKKKKKKEKGGV